MKAQSIQQFAIVQSDSAPAFEEELNARLMELSTKNPKEVHRMVYATNEKRDYCQVLDAALAPMMDFDSLDYCINGVTQEEYLKLSDRLGSVCYFDVTGMTCGEILKDICKVVLLDQARLAPDSVITDIRKKRKVADMFRR